MIATEAKDLTREDYDLFRKLVYAKSGINLGEHKMQLVRARLGKRVRDGGFHSFRQYYHHIEEDTTGAELCSLLDAISTNTTHLFREMQHFNLLRDLLRRWAEDKTWCRRHSTVRIWSAACSSGEEPHSIVMTAHDVLRHHPQLSLKILASDISTQMLSVAQQGLYEIHRVGTVPAEYRQRYFQRVPMEGQQVLQVVPELRRLITFARFNLMTPSFPFKHGFHVIFCRNVMIYFDKPTQEILVGKMATHLHADGHLMIGHSESLNGLQQPLQYVQPTVYRKP